jgi:hypothetical protein
MAGLMKALFGGKPSPAVDAEPAPGIGGYNMGPGPANQTGFPGSTSQTRTNRGKSPRAVKVRADTNTGIEQAMGTTPETRQSSYRGDVPGARVSSPRSTPTVTIPQTRVRQDLQNNSQAEFFGGPALHTRPGNQTAGGYIDRSAAMQMGLPGADSRDTTTPWTEAQPVVSGNVPGAQNVRNEVAQRYKNPPGTLKSYKSAARPDQAPPNVGGQATDGNVHPDRVTQDVIVPSRFVFDNGGNQTWSVLREMPYGGRGDGARGADLNGQRFYATGQQDQFWNGAQGSYGVERLRGGKRPVSFTQPAPWSSQVYDTTASVGTTDNPNMSPAQQPQAVYTSPGGLRASNRTGRTG